jgi:hypothetical protein
MNRSALQQGLLIVCASLLVAAASAGEGGDKPVAPIAKPKSRINTQIYEKEDAQKTFTATVKMVRESQGVWEVFFNEQKGAFSVEEAHQALLVDAQKSKAPVIVKVDAETNHIVSVQASTARPPQNPLGK